MKLSNILNEITDQSIRIVGDFELYKGKRTGQGSYYIRNNKTNEYWGTMPTGTMQYMKKLPDIEFTKKAELFLSRQAG